MAQLSLRRARNDLAQARLDGLLILSPLHFYYATGHSSWFLNLYGEAGFGAAVIPTDARQTPGALVSDVEVPNFAQTAPEFAQVKGYPSWVAYADLPQPAQTHLNWFEHDRLPQLPTRQGLIDRQRAVELLVELLVDCGLVRGKVGLEGEFAAGSVLRHLKRALPRVEFVDALPLLQRWRAYKTPQEAAWLRQGTQLAELALEQVMKGLEPGLPAGEIAHRYRLSVFERASSGLVTNARITLRVGPQVLSPQAASSYVLQLGDLVFLDVGVEVAGYWADIGRTCVLGQASRLQKEVYQALQQGFLAGEAQLVSGNLPALVINAGLAAAKQAGLPHYVRGNVGHGIGLHRAPEKPLLSREEELPLGAGQVVSMEFPLYAQGLGALTLEDTFHFTSDGIEVWNRLSRDLLEV